MIDKHYVVSALTFVFCLMILLVALYTLFVVESLKGQTQPKATYIAGPSASVLPSPTLKATPSATVKGPVK